eukprot:6211367-Pleurochrysis_carterae.AAC.1
MGEAALWIDGEASLETSCRKSRCCHGRCWRQGSRAAGGKWSCLVRSHLQHSVAADLGLSFDEIVRLLLASTVVLATHAFFAHWLATTCCMGMAHCGGRRLGLWSKCRSLGPTMERAP